MNCINHYVEVDIQSCNLFCPTCKKQLSDKEAKRCLKEILLAQTSVDFAFSFLKSVADGIKSGNMDEAEKIYRMGLKKNEKN